MEKVRLLFVMVLIAILLIPVMGFAGSLEPSGPPAPTMQSLDKIPPAWSQKLQCDTAACPRFELVMDGEAVLDKETGLVWSHSNYNISNFYSAVQNCRTRIIGNRMGWRLPTAAEFYSLLENRNPPGSGVNLGIPSASPLNQLACSGGGFWTFSNVQNDETAHVFWFGQDGPHNKLTGTHCSRCVRGGQAYDGS